MCSDEIQIEVDEMTKNIEEQGKIVSVIVNAMDEMDSNKLEVNDEWKSFERTAWLKKFVDAEITLLDLRISRCELKAGDIF